MKLILISTLAALSFSSCTTGPKANYADETQIRSKYRYYSKLKKDVEPKWIEQMNASKALKKTNLKKNNISKVSFEVDPNGAIKNIKIMKPSLVPQADKLAMSVIQNTKRLPKPPADLVVDGKTEVEWEFILQK